MLATKAEVKFHSIVKFEKVGRFNYKLLEPFSFTSTDRKHFTIPAGFETDLATIPRFLWGVLPPHDGHYDESSLMHDWLYVKAIGNKWWADWQFFIGMKAEGNALWKRCLMYLVVTLKGRGNYRRR